MNFEWWDEWIDAPCKGVMWLALPIKSIGTGCMKYGVKKNLIIFRRIEWLGWNTIWVEAVLQRSYFKRLPGLNLPYSVEYKENNTPLNASLNTPHSVSSLEERHAKPSFVLWTSNVVLFTPIDESPNDRTAIDDLIFDWWYICIATPWRGIIWLALGAAQRNPGLYRKYQESAQQRDLLGVLNWIEAISRRSYLKKQSFLSIFVMTRRKKWHYIPKQIERLDLTFWIVFREAVKLRC